MTLKRHEEILLALLRFALNGIPLPLELFSPCIEEDWNRCFKLASDQGVMAIAWDAVMSLPSDLQPQKSLKIRWALAVEEYSRTYRRYCSVLGELSDFYAGHGISLVQLKGVGLSTYYPVPERRQGGDLDIYTFSADTSEMTDTQANELADNLMRDRGIEVDLHSYKHSNFYFKGIPVENHKFFANVKNYTEASEAEVLLHKYLNPVPVKLCGGVEILIPSPEFNSIFVSLHAMQHFTSGLCLHHLCDWACVLKRIGVDLPLSVGNSRFKSAIHALTQICREYLGVDVAKEEGYEDMMEVIMKEVLNPEFHKGDMPHGRLAIFWYKVRRFVYSAKLRSKVWNVNFADTLWRSVVAHIKNPETIFARGE